MHEYSIYSIEDLQHILDELSLRNYINGKCWSKVLLHVLIDIETYSYDIWSSHVRLQISKYCKVLLSLISHRCNHTWEKISIQHLITLTWLSANLLLCQRRSITRHSQQQNIGVTTLPKPSFLMKVTWLIFSLF